MTNLITRYYTAHRDELVAFAASRLSDASLAEDIVQDTFLRLLQSDQMISEVTLPCLVYTIMRNRIADYFRRHTNRVQYEHYITSSGDSEESMESVFSAQDIIIQLEKGLARLPKNCQEVYRLHIYGGMKVGEIALRLHEDYRSVERRLGTARKVIRQRLRNCV